MSFVAPLMLLGLLGALIPIAIHLIGRRRARELDFAALDFLLGSDEKVARHLRLRELLLLLLRAAVCAVLALILAKPYAHCDARGPVVERGPQAAVIVLDDSLVMRARIGDETLASRAQTRARAILDGLGPEADVALVRTAAGASAEAELSRDHLALRNRLAELEPTYEPADIGAALRRAAQLLAADEHEQQTIYLVSPVTAAGLGDVELSFLAGPDAPALRVVDPSDGAAIENAAVTDIRVEADPAAGARGIRVIAEIANFGQGPVREREVSLLVDGDVVARGLVSVDPGQRTRKRFSAALEPETRAAAVAVALAADALPQDDRRHAIAEPRDEIPVLLVDGDPRTVRHEDELFYLEAALRPGDRGDSGAVLTTVTADRLGEMDLAGFDVIVLANVAALSDDTAAALAEWVEGGGGLFITLGNRVDPERYRETMGPLLPQRLQSLLDVSAGSAAGAADPSLHLSRLERDHPIFAVFAEGAAGLSSGRFSRIVLLGPTTEVDERRVLARYDNGAAALVEARRGKGRLLLFTSSIDRDWNDLPIQPGFLPLAQQAVRYLARKPFSRRDSQLLVGHAAALRVGPEDAVLEIHGPGGRRTTFEGNELAGRELVRFRKTDRPGVYRVRAAAKGKDSRPRPEASFAVNIDPRASDLRRADTAALARPESGDAPATAAGPRQRRVELWHAIAAALLGLLLFESVLAATRR